MYIYFPKQFACIRGHYVVLLPISVRQTSVLMQQLIDQAIAAVSSTALIYGNNGHVFL